jgi:hypothetical protein
MYDRFWFNENPRESVFQGFDFTAELNFDCALLNVMDLDGTVNTSRGGGKISSIQLDFKTNLMTIKGTV